MIPEMDTAALARDLAGNRFGRRILHFHSLESTNDCALALLEEGEVEGTLVLAEEQTRGRGRRERTWYSPPRHGIYASLVLRPSLPVAFLPLVSFAGALGAARHLGELGLSPVTLKWPNDLLLAGRKVGGFLAEARGGPARPGVVVGLGLNVNQEETDFPPDLRSAATSLRTASGRLWDRDRLLAGILRLWEEEYDGLHVRGPEQLLRRFQEFSEFSPGSCLEIETGAGRLSGRYAGVGSSGELLLDTGSASLRAFHFAEVLRVREG